MRDIGACFYYAKKQFQNNNRIITTTKFSKTMYNTLSSFGVHTIGKTMGPTEVGLLSFFSIVRREVQSLTRSNERRRRCVL